MKWNSLNWPFIIKFLQISFIQLFLDFGILEVADAKKFFLGKFFSLDFIDILRAEQVTLSALKSLLMLQHYCTYYWRLNDCRFCFLYFFIISSFTLKLFYNILFISSSSLSTCFSWYLSTDISFPHFFLLLPRLFWTTLPWIFRHKSSVITLSLTKKYLATGSTDKTCKGTVLSVFHYIPGWILWKLIFLSFFTGMAW